MLPRDALVSSTRQAWQSQERAGVTPRNGVYLMSARGGAAGGHGQQGPPQTPLLVLTLSGGPWAISGWDGREPSVSV